MEVLISDDQKMAILGHAAIAQTCSTKLYKNRRKKYRNKEGCTLPAYLNALTLHSKNSNEMHWYLSLSVEWCGWLTTLTYSQVYDRFAVLLAHFKEVNLMQVWYLQPSFVVGLTHFIDFPRFGVCHRFSEGLFHIADIQRFGRHFPIIWSTATRGIPVRSSV